MQSLVSAFWNNRPSLEHYLKHVIARQQHQTAEFLDQITMPALVLIGDRDTNVGGTGSHWKQPQYLCTHLPHATLPVIAETAHRFFWQKPGETMAAIAEFLSAQR